MSARNNQLAEDELFCDAEEMTKDQISSRLAQEFFRNVFVAPKRGKCDEDYGDPDDEDDDEEEEDYDEYDESCYGTTGDFCQEGTAGKNVQQSSSSIKSIQPREHIVLPRSINLEMYHGMTLPKDAVNTLQESQRRIDNNRLRIKDKEDRATVEQALDDKTHFILWRLLVKGVFDRVEGCVSTGKEANVYRAVKNVTDENGQETIKLMAVKVFKTSILKYKDRDAFVTGEHRWANGYAKRNPRKKIKVWAEKEFRNLKRLYGSGRIKGPEPMELKGNVIVMGFIGDYRDAAPKLKNVKLTEREARTLYREVVLMMWNMYNVCKLVHADLSEYNMLYYNSELYVIDVSQSVEHDHPNSLKFLRSDCEHVTVFFKAKGVAVMSIKELFDFITDVSITDQNVEECLDVLSKNAAEKPAETTNEEKISEEVFKHAYIPSKLRDVVNFERDINEVKSGAMTDLIYRNLVGLQPDLSGTVQQPEILRGTDNNEESEHEGEEKLEEKEAEKKESKFVNSARPKEETAEEKKLRKQSVQAARQVRRVEKKNNKILDKNRKKGIAVAKSKPA